jgi:outer membrane protein TolC
MKIKIFPIASIALTLALIVPATGNALTIEEAVTLALENNHIIKKANFEYSAARETIGAARAGFLPTLSASYTYARSSQEAYLTSSEYSAATITAAYNIFSGFSHINRMRETEARASAAKYMVRSTRADISLGAKKAYTELLRAEGALITAREGVALLERQQDNTELFFREGLIAKNELLKINVELAKAKQTLLEAGGSQRHAFRTLENIIGKTLSGENIAHLSEITETHEMNYEAMKVELLENRSELKYLKSIGLAYDHAADSALGAMMPKVDVSMSFSEYGDDPVIGSRETPYSEETVTMITASWTIFDGLRSNHTKTRLRYLGRAAAEELRHIKKKLLLQLVSSVDAYAIAREKIIVAGTAVEEATENYRVTELQYKERIATTTDLLDARNYLTDAKDSQNNSFYDLHIALAAIERVLERNVPEAQ